MTDTAKTFPLPSEKPDVLAFLATRRSNLAKVMSAPGPTEDVLSELLTIAARVPDHRKLTPWRFVIFQDEARAEFGQHIATAFLRDNPKAPIDRSLFEGQRLLRAPLVVAVIYSPKDCARGTPKWEQQLSAGAVCFNLCLAAQAKGFAAQWLTEWYAYEASVNAALGLAVGEQVAGYIYIGSTETPATERARPDIKEKVSYWGV